MVTQSDQVVTRGVRWFLGMIMGLPEAIKIQGITSSDQGVPYGYQW